MNKDELVDYLKKTNMVLQSGKACFFIGHVVFDAYVTCEQAQGVSYDSMLCGFKNKTFFEMIPNQALFRIAKNNYEEYINNHKHWLKKRKKGTELENALKEIWIFCFKKNVTNKQLLQKYKRAISLSNDWWRYYGIIQEDKGEILRELIIPYFEKRFGMSKEQAQRFVEITSHPKEQSEFLSERKLFYEICLYIALNNNLKGLLSHRLYDELEKDSVLKKKIDIYITKYFFSKTDFYNYQILSTESVLKDVGRGLQEHTLQDIKKELQKLNFQKLKIEKTKQKLLEKYSLNQLDKKNILFAQSITREGDTRKTSMMTQLYYIFTLIDKIASLKGITYQQIANLTPEEVEDLLQGKKFSDKHYEKRENTVVLYEPRKKRTCFYGTDADDLFKAMNDFLLSDKEIKGNVASKGYSNKNLQTGVVRILTDPINEQFYKGEILVTTMTRIEFVPIMKKAAAIITDEGGIASHAAVVSRELGIPCIVGTKVATKRLKTGDFVEMNLKTGVVRKIKYELKKNEF